MDEETRVITGATLVAVAGGIMAFLMMTNLGRGALRGVGPALDDVSCTLQEVRTIVHKIDDVVQEAQAMVADVRAVLPSMRTTDSPHEVPYGV